MCQRQIEKEKKYMENYQHKRKNLLIICVEELENLCFNRFLNFMKVVLSLKS